MGTFDNFIIKSFLFGKAPLDQRSNYRVIFNLIGLNFILAIQEKEPIMPCHYGKNGQTREKYLILDSTLDQGIKMSDEEYTVEFLLINYLMIQDYQI